MRSLVGSSGWPLWQSWASVRRRCPAVQHLALVGAAAWWLSEPTAVRNAPTHCLLQRIDRQQGQIFSSTLNGHCVRRDSQSLQYRPDLTRLGGSHEDSHSNHRAFVMRAEPAGRPPAAERGPDRPDERAQRPKAALDQWKESSHQPSSCVHGPCSCRSWSLLVSPVPGVSLAVQALPYPVGQGSALPTA
jgi:hypothetical protein